MDTFILVLSSIVLLYVSYRYATWSRNKDQREGDEIEENRIQKRIELLSSVVLKVVSNFKFDLCSRCNDKSVSILNFNSIGNSVNVKCDTCGKKTWVKAKGGFEKGQEIIDMWEETKDLSDLIGNGASVPSFNIIVDDIEDKLTQDHRKPISQSVKDKVWNRDGGKCVECDSDKKLEFDHIIPFSKGGSNTYRNLQLLCENCNRKKSDKIG